MSRFYVFPIYNLRQNNWNKMEKSSKTGQEKKSLVSVFSNFQLLLPKPNFFKGDWALGNVSNEILDFSNIS